MKQPHSFPYDYPAHDFEPSADAPSACEICAAFAQEADAERTYSEAVELAREELARDPAAVVTIHHGNGWKLTAKVCRDANTPAGYVSLCSEKIDHGTGPTHSPERNRTPSELEYNFEHARQQERRYGV